MRRGGGGKEEEEEEDEVPVEEDDARRRFHRRPRAPPIALVARRPLCSGPTHERIPGHASVCFRAMRFLAGGAESYGS